MPLRGNKAKMVDRVQVGLKICKSRVQGYLDALKASATVGQCGKTVKADQGWSQYLAGGSICLPGEEQYNQKCVYKI